MSSEAPEAVSVHHLFTKCMNNVVCVCDYHLGVRHGGAGLHCKGGENCRGVKEDSGRGDEEEG